MLVISQNMYRLLLTKISCRIPALLASKSHVTEINVYKYNNFFYKSFVSSALPRNAILPVCADCKAVTLIQGRRWFSKKKSSKHSAEEEESDSDEESYESYETENIDEFGTNIIKKSVLSTRLDTVIKAGFRSTKKKIEKNFYANKIRLNGEAALKKAINVRVDDEIDVIKGFSPESSRFLIIDRIIIKSIGKVSATGTIPVTMEVLKELTIENYEKPWSPSNLRDLED